MCLCPFELSCLKHTSVLLPLPSRFSTRHALNKFGHWLFVVWQAPRQLRYLNGTGRSCAPSSSLQQWGLGEARTGHRRATTTASRFPQMAHPSTLEIPWVYVSNGLISQPSHFSNPMKTIKRFTNLERGRLICDWNEDKM